MSGAGAHRGPVPALQADEIERVQQMVANGVSPTLIAAEFRVSLRTVYRYRDRRSGGGGFKDSSAEPWVAACMEPDEWALWVSMNPRLTQGATAERPCRDCPVAFSREMRAIGRCNGYPGGTAEEEDEMEITRARAKPVQVEVIIPCGRCTHREVCGIRASIEKLGDVDVALPELNAALTPRLAVSIECGFFSVDKSVPKPERPAKRTGAGGRPAVSWTPEARAAASERMRERRAAERETAQS